MWSDGPEVALNWLFPHRLTPGQVSPALTRARTAVDAYHNRLWKAEAKLRHTLREHVDLSHNILNVRFKGNPF
jgi:hypothetical protein